MIKRIKDEPIIHLGDSIDYGLHPNEVIEELKKLDILVNIQGNHERLLKHKEELSYFSNDRGRKAHNYTKRILKEQSIAYIESMSDGPVEMEISGFKMYFIHGGKENPYWRDLSLSEDYSMYDYVFFGHSHIPSLFSKNGTTFINPGSVGQPRNGNPNAQYVKISDDRIEFLSVPYDISKEVASFKGEIDRYYIDRLFIGV